MGIASFAFAQTLAGKSFTRRKEQGEQFVALLETSPEAIYAADGSTAAVLTLCDALPYRGRPLFSLTYVPEVGYTLLDNSKNAVLTSSLAAEHAEAQIKDKHGRVMTTISKHTFAWEECSYVWTTRIFDSSTRFMLKEVAKDGKAESSKPLLATLKLPTHPEASVARLIVEPSLPNALPLGLLLFQAMVIVHQWTGLKVSLTPLKKMAFASSNWV